MQKTSCFTDYIFNNEWRFWMIVNNRMMLSAAMAATILLGACSSAPVSAPPLAKETTPVAQSAPVAPIAKPATPAPVVSAPIAPYLDPKSALYQERSVYFDFDQYQLKPEATRMLDLHGKYLAAHPNLAIKIEGNTDEQGGAEYNLALGQKRAEAVRKTLSIYGVKPAQMEAISFGKEKPKSTGHDEASHARNRRADLAYPTK